jgi:hypothetical protein
VFVKRRAVRGELSVIVMDRRPFATLVLALAASVLAGAAAEASGASVPAATFAADGSIGDLHCQAIGIPPADRRYALCRASDQSVLSRQPPNGQCSTWASVQSALCPNYLVMLDQALLQVMKMDQQQTAQERAQAMRTRQLTLQLEQNQAQAIQSAGAAEAAADAAAAQAAAAAAAKQVGQEPARTPRPHTGE